MRRAAPQRRGFVMVVLLVTIAIVLMFVLVIARLAILELARERQTALEEQAAQVWESARTWSRLHADQLAGGQPVQLPVAELLPPPVRGAVELRRVGTDEGGVVHCRVTLERSGKQLHQDVAWPAGL